jgi:hypothetical protein
MTKIRLGERIEREEVVLDVHDVIGGGSEVIDSSVTILKPRDCGVHCTRFRNSSIRVVKTCNKEWFGCFFDGCFFRGRYYDCRFGCMPSDECQIQPGLRNCDFSKASLNLCSFWNCTPADLKMPSWPHVTIFEPAKNAADFAELCSDPFLEWIHELTRDRTEVTAVIYNLPKFLRQETPRLQRRWDLKKLLAKAGGKLPPDLVLSVENAKRLLESKPYVYM